MALSVPEQPLPINLLGASHMAPPLNHKAVDRHQLLLNWIHAQVSALKYQSHKKQRRVLLVEHHGLPFPRNSATCTRSA